MHYTRQNHRGITGKHMLKHYLKLLAIKLPATLLAGFTLLTLSIQPAHADFRKALTAYQNRDGQTMLKEVQDAVDTKNDDGLVLFISALQLDQILATSRLYASEEESNLINEVVTKSKKPPETLLHSLLTDNDVSALYKMLEGASKKSSLEAQYEYLLLIYGGYYQSPFLNIGNNQENDNPLWTSMELLAKKGYSKAAFFLSYPQTVTVGNAKENNWFHKAYKQGYRVKLNKDVNSYVGDIKKTNNSPVLSIHRYSGWATTYSETNYFLDVYADGNVNFSRGMLEDIPKNKLRIIQKISQNDLKQLIASIKDMGFYQQPISNTNGFGDNMGYTPDFGGYSITRTYLITLREKNTARTLSYIISEEDRREKDIPPFFLKALKHIENVVPTQFYRCGSETQRDYYKHCITKDF